MATRDKPLKDLVGVWPIFGYKFWIQILHSDLERGVMGGHNLILQCTAVQARQAKTRKNDGSLYLEAVDLTLRETPQPGSVPSSD